MKARMLGDGMLLCDPCYCRRLKGLHYCTGVASHACRDVLRLQVFHFILFTRVELNQSRIQSATMPAMQIRT